jgi:hypothetical protein
MRRLVLSLLAASSVALLTACGQGGSAFNTGTPTNISHVQIESSGNPPGVFKVVPGGTIKLSAVGTNGSGFINQNDTSYNWTYNVTASGAFYNSSATATTACPVMSGFSGTLPAILKNSSGTVGVTVASSDATVLLTPPASITAFGPAAAGASYCLTINATHISDGVTGSAYVYVGN